MKFGSDPLEARAGPHRGRLVWQENADGEGEYVLTEEQKALVRDMQAHPELQSALTWWHPCPRFMVPGSMQGGRPPL